MSLFFRKKLIILLQAEICWRLRRELFSRVSDLEHFFRGNLDLMPVSKNIKLLLTILFIPVCIVLFLELTKDFTSVYCRIDLFEFQKVRHDIVRVEKALESWRVGVDQGFKTT